MRFLLDTNILSDLVRHPHRPILEHVVDSGEDGGCDGYDGLLGAAPVASIARCATNITHN